MVKTRKAVYLITLVIALALLLSSCVGRVPKPTVREGRFNFSVTYEVNGEVKTVEGVYVAEFVKGVATLSGYYREWNGYIENSDIEDENEIEILRNEDGVIYLDLGLDPEYFMSDPFFHSIAEPELTIFYREEIAEERYYFSSDPEVLLGYGVRIIGFEFDEPIENVFK